MGLLVSYNQDDLNAEKLAEKYKLLYFNKLQYFENVVNNSRWSNMEQLKLYQGPVENQILTLNQQNTNAYYRMSTNEILVPRGILQAPFFSLSNPE
jgi:predicted metalloendopeptidase